MNKKDFYKKAKEKNITFSSYAKNIIEKIDFTAKKQEIVSKTVAELGFENSATYKEIIEKAGTQGLEKIHPANFLEYILDYTGEWIVCCMEPTVDSGGGPSLLDAYRRGDGRWLYAFCDRPDDRWGRDSGFAFAVSQVLDTKALGTSLETQPLELPELTDEVAIAHLKKNNYRITKLIETEF